MSIIEGLRVVRGPDWSHGNEDGDEGHVGTITDDNEDDTVEVQWDMGNDGVYNTGKNKKRDLRVLDSGPAGLKHPDTTCAGCRKKDFVGTCWTCQKCPKVSLCSQCYFNDKHDMAHPFYRIDYPGKQGVPVNKRSISTRMRALGIFKGAKVKRGRDWESGKQDGGEGKIGTVVEVNNYSSKGHERDAVKVTWPANKDGNTYRLGYRGKVDLECVEVTPGFEYYRDHLFALDTTQSVASSSSSASGRPLPQRQLSFVRPPPVGPKPPPGARQAKPQPGDKVCVELPEVALKELQRGHGGWSMRMKEYIGQHGVVKSFSENGDCVVDYDGKEWTFNANAIRKVPSLKVGDIVQMIADADKAQALQIRHGGWQPEMTKALGKVGKVVKIDADGDVAVAFGNVAWVFNAACCTPAPGSKVDELNRPSSGAMATPRQGSTSSASGADGGGGGDDADDGETDLAAEALGQMIAQMFFGGIRVQIGVGPQQLVQAAANGDATAVEKILKDKPALVDQKFKGLTALIIASHEGNQGVVGVLIKYKAGLNHREEKGNTALMAALMKTKEVVAKMLIDAGADIHLWNNQGRTALHFAAANEANMVLRILLSKKADPNRQDAAGDTPVHDAILNKNDPGVTFLVADSRINLTLRNKKGHPPLHLAAMKDDEISVMRILSKAPQLKDSQKGDGYTALHICAVNDNTDTITALIKAKANVDATAQDNSTPLHLAAHQGYIDSVKLLVEASAEVNAVDNDGDTPLHNCVMGRRSGGQSGQWRWFWWSDRGECRRWCTDGTRPVRHALRCALRPVQGEGSRYKVCAVRTSSVLCTLLVPSERMSTLQVADTGTH